MTCQECQPLAIDLARGLPPFDVGGAVQRADVLSHIAACKRCARWWREQEALSDALRAVAAADASLAAPPGVEANVMAAWRARQTQRQLSLARPEPPADAWVPQIQAVARAWRPAWPAGRAVGFAAAASIVFATLTLPMTRWLKSPPASNGGTTNVASASTPRPFPLPPPSTPAGRSGGRAGESGATVTGTNAAVIEVLPDKGRKTTKGRPRRRAPLRRELPRHEGSPRARHVR